MISGRPSVGVEISERTVRLAMVQPGAVPKVLKVKEVPLPEGGGARALGKVVAKALGEMKAKAANVHVVFSPPPTETLRHALFTGPRLNKRELQQVVARELRKDAQIQPAQVYAEAEPMDQVKVDGVMAQRYLLLAMSRRLLDDGIDSLIDAKLVLRSMSSVAMGVLRAASLVHLPESKHLAVLHVDERRSLLMVMENGMPLFFREFPIELRSENGETEYMTQALAREVELSLVYFAQQNRPKRVDTVLVVGSGEESAKVAEWLEDRSTYALATFGANEKLQVDPSVQEPLAPFAGAIGAGLGRKGALPIPDLLPAELRVRPERMLGVMAAAALVIGFLFFCVHLRAGETERYDAAAQKVAKLQTALASMEPAIEEAAKADREAAYVMKWQAFFEATETRNRKWAAMLTELSKKMPMKVHLTQFTTTSRTQKDPKNPRAKEITETYVRLNGATRGNDAREAQEHLRELVAVAQALPTVSRTNLPSLPRPVIGDDGLTRIDFSLELFYENRTFSGGK